MTFFNTIEAQSPQLELFNHQMNAQNKRVLDLFKAHQGAWLSTQQFYNLYIKVYPEVIGKNGKKYTEPHSSIKRAITDLTEQFLLEKCAKDRMIMGEMGKPVYLWRVV